ncbi:preprotein translocase subunit YajC [Ruminococcus flavefaciens]|uniref:preprotein translocase subunit YajC n=1 Tax=Ruminococcus flavefaciens TaxID=1265 RepID=UPI00048D3D2D|nr:preprotein translocase subunit YajC [Ruminococcus flavefaciens]
MKINKLIASVTAAASTAVIASATALNAFAEDSEQATTANQQQASMGNLLSMPIMLILMFVLLYFFAIRPQKKRDKELKEMQQSLQVGDEVVTGGGIVGIVVSVGDDTVVIETGGAKHKLRIKNWAITENVSAAERFREAKAGAKGSSTVEAAAVVDDDDDKKSKKKKNDEE